MKAGWQYLLWSVLALGVCASALWVVNTSHEIRQMHKRMQAARESYDEQLAMQSRLLLERSAAAAFISSLMVVARTSSAPRKM